MFGQMHSGNRNRRIIWRPCPCLNICPCHYGSIKSDKQKRELTILYCIIGICLFILLSMIILGNSFKQNPQIKVNEQWCDIVYMEDGINSTGAGYGHSEAKCRK